MEKKTIKIKINNEIIETKISPEVYRTYGKKFFSNSNFRVRGKVMDDTIMPSNDYMYFIYSYGVGGNYRRIINCNEKVVIDKYYYSSDGKRNTIAYRGKIWRE